MKNDDYIVPSVMDLVAVFALFVFMLSLLCFCVLPSYSVNKDLYKEKIKFGEGDGERGVGLRVDATAKFSSLLFTLISHVEHEQCWSGDDETGRQSLTLNGRVACKVKSQSRPVFAA